MADVLPARAVAVLRAATVSLFDNPPKIPGIATVIDLCDSHEELRRMLLESDTLVVTATEALHKATGKIEEMTDALITLKTLLRTKLPPGTLPDTGPEAQA